MEIRTELIGQEDLFKILTVAMNTKLPILLVGEKGTGKTQSFFDFCNSLKMKTFVYQLSYDTRREDILGYINIKKLIKEGEIERINGLDNNVEAILIDEIDKANSQVRNLFLSILREKKIFNGSNLISLNYKLLVGTSNQMEFLEEDEPFLDRFLLKFYVKKIDNINLINSQFHEQTIIINKKQINEIIYDTILKLTINNPEFSNISNRTARHTPLIIRELLNYFEAIKVIEILFNSLFTPARSAIYLQSQLNNVLEVLNLYEKYKLLNEIELEKVKEKYEELTNGEKELLEDIWKSI